MNPNIIDTVYVPHQIFTQSLERLTSYRIKSQSSDDAIALTVTGPSRWGKSRLCREFVKTKSPYVTPEGQFRPILLVNVPSTPNKVSIVQAILRALGDRHWDDGRSIVIKSARIQDMMDDALVEAIVFDEMNHVADEGTLNSLYAVSNWLKTFMDERKRLVILSGLQTVDWLVDKNEQLVGRFSDGIILDRFSWQNNTSRGQFRTILAAFQDGVKPYELPDIASTEMAFRFFHATGGIPGYIKKILRKAIWDATDRKSHSISLHDLAAAWELAVRKGNRIRLNPFTEEFMSSSEEEQAALAASVGMALEAPKAKKIKHELAKIERQAK